MGGSVSGINFLPIIHMYTIVHMCAFIKSIQVINIQQRLLHAWLTRIVPIMIRIVIRTCLIIVNIVGHFHIPLIIIISNHHSRFYIVLREWSLNFKLVAFCYWVSQPIVRLATGHKSWVPVALGSYCAGPKIRAPFQGHL